MNTYYCGQRGCEFESEIKMAKCPICGQPFFNHPYKETSIEKQIEPVIENNTAIESNN